MGKISIKNDNYTENVSQIRAAGTKLNLAMETDGGPNTSKTVANFEKVIKRGNTHAKKLAEIVATLSDDLSHVQETYKSADDTMRKAVQDVQDVVNAAGGVVADGKD